MSVIYQRRINAPTASNKYFTSTAYGGYSNCETNLDNPAWKGATINNCVGYCWGRLAECVCTNGKCEDLGMTAKQIIAKRPRGDAKTIYANTSGSDFWVHSSTPKIGFFAVYKKGKYGHVSFVEKVYSNGNVDFSNNNSWTKPIFKYYTNVNPKTVFSGYELQGYVGTKVNFQSPQTSKKK